MLETINLSETLEALVNECNEHHPGLVTFLGRGEMLGYLKFRLGFAPGGRAEYMAINYETLPSMSPGIVSCDDEAEAKMFLTLLRDRFALPDPDFDYDRVTQAAERVELFGLGSAASRYTGDHDPSSLPTHEEETPYWMRETSEWRGGADTFITAGWGDCTVEPEEGDKSLCIWSEMDDGEEEVELGEGSEVLEWWGIKDGSLEWFLWHQLFCHNKNLAIERPQYAYIHYIISSDLWLRPVPSNLEFLSRTVKSEAFGDHYDWTGMWGNTIQPWLDAVLEEIAEDDQQLLDKFSDVWDEVRQIVEEKY